MSVIEKKALREGFEKVLNGSKTFELRLADWVCEEGDTLILKEYDPEKRAFTGREIKKKVGHISKTKDCTYFEPTDVEKHGYQVVSLLPESSL